MLIHGEEVIEPSDSEKPESAEVENACADFPHVEAVDAKYADEVMEEVSNAVVVFSKTKTRGRFLCHRGNEKDVNDPANTEKSPSRWSTTEPQT